LENGLSAQTCAIRLVSGCCSASKICARPLKPAISCGSRACKSVKCPVFQELLTGFFVPDFLSGQNGAPRFYSPTLYELLSRIRMTARIPCVYLRLRMRIQYFTCEHVHNARLNTAAMTGSCDCDNEFESIWVDLRP
jgi:hypothetical protein